MVKKYPAMVKTLLGPIGDAYGSNTVQRLVGFYVVWHLFDGFDGLKAAGWNRSQIWRNRKDFHKVFGVDVEDMWPELRVTVEGMRDVGK